MSLTTRVLAGLAAGLVLGTFASRAPALAELARLIEPLGALFINAIRMTVVPLVVSSLVMGVASAPDPRTIGRVGWRAFALFIAVMFASTIFGAVLGPPLLAGLPIDPETAIALRQSAEAAGGVEERARTIPGFSQWLVNLVPSNPLRAAADDAMLPLIIFTLAFAVALLRVSEERRRIVVGFFHGVFDAMLVLVRWVLELAPLGVFALALPLATRMGLAAAGALAYYVALVAILSTTFALVVLYPAAVILGRVSLREFARAAAPAQAVAFSARSSLASLPAMIEGARARLRLPVEVTNFYLPLAASVFRTGTGIGLTVGVLFVARLYGLELSPAQLASVALTVVLTSFSVPGIPAGSILVMVPVASAAGIPIAGIGLLLGIDTIPDMFRTTLNVTGHMAGATIVSRGSGSAPARGPTDVL